MVRCTQLSTSKSYDSPGTLGNLVKLAPTSELYEELQEIGNGAAYDAESVHINWTSLYFFSSLNIQNQ